MKYIIIGAGISGMSIARLLQNAGNQVVVYERDSRPGGIIKCDSIEGNLFHRTGGHVFNTKRKDVANWFWSFFNKETEFIKTIRKSSVFMDNGLEIPYPIENHAYMLGQEIGKQIVKDLCKMTKEADLLPNNFEEFLKKQFGKTLYELYFKPYNKKIWRRDLTKVPLSWLEGKLPMPTVEEIIFNNIYHIKEDKFVHSSFFYPLKGGSQFIADTLATGLDIKYNSPVIEIRRTKAGWAVNGELYNRVIYCGNIKQIPNLLKNQIQIESYTNNIELLEYHGTTSVFCEIDKNPYSWIYLPSEKHDAHRIICTGNFSNNNNATLKNTATIEFTDYISKEDIITQLRKIPLNPKYITHNYEKYTYPIQNSNTRGMIKELKKVLAIHGFYLCGRFAEWEYYNMDICLGSALDLFNNELSK